METLSNYLSPFDDLEFICDVHDIPCIGLCSNCSCKEKTKFLCIKCIKSGTTCITKEKHELTTLSEIIFRFFLKIENKSFDLDQILKMEQTIKEINDEEFNKTLSLYKEIQIKNIKTYEKVKETFINIINDLITFFKDSNITELNIIKYKSKIQLNSGNDNNKEYKLFFDMKIPDEKILKTKDNLIQYINEKYKNIPANDLINQAKLLYDSYQFLKTTKALKDNININEITKISEDKKKNLEQKLDNILNDFERQFDQEISKLEEKFILPKENPSIYIFYNNKTKFQNDPKELIYKEDICSNAHKTNSIDSVFCAFRSFNGESLVVWGSTTHNIEIYDCEQRKIIKTYNRAHNQTIFSCRHYPNYKQKKDYIISSSNDRTVKVWDCIQSSCILSIPMVHHGYYIYSVCLLCHELKETNYIITSCPNEKMKIWDFNGNYLRNAGQNNESTYFIDVFYNKEIKKYFIINANSNDVKSYYFETGALFKNYKGLPQTWHMSAVVNETKECLALIESDGNGTIRIWNFDTAELLKSINSAYSINLRGICLWNDKYLFAAGNDSQVKLFDLEEGKFVKSFKGHTSTVCTIEKIMHPKYGGCLISQALDGRLKLWIPENKE